MKNKLRKKSAPLALKEEAVPYRVNGNGNGSNGHLKESLPLWRKPSKDKPRILDLFCCAGGVAMGYSRAGFDVVGVDIDPQPRFPFEFIQADALTLDMKFIKSFDAIHASPPCQSYSDLAKRNGNAHEWPRLVDPVREMLIKSGKPFVIENVEGAPLINPIVLCGTMFKGLRVLRHRLLILLYQSLAVHTRIPHRIPERRWPATR